MTYAKVVRNNASAWGSPDASGLNNGTQKSAIKNSPIKQDRYDNNGVTIENIVQERCVGAHAPVLCMLISEIPTPDVRKTVPKVKPGEEAIWNIAR